MGGERKVEKRKVRGKGVKRKEMKNDRDWRRDWMEVDMCAATTSFSRYSCVSGVCSGTSV